MPIQHEMLCGRDARPFALRKATYALRKATDEFYQQFAHLHNKGPGEIIAWLRSVKALTDERQLLAECGILDGSKYAVVAKCGNQADVRDSYSRGIGWLEKNARDVQWRQAVSAMNPYEDSLVICSPRSTRSLDLARMRTTAGGIVAVDCNPGLIMIPPQIHVQPSAVRVIAACYENSIRLGAGVIWIGE